MNLWAVFITGLFAGGASCAAVQGGLLAGAVARRSSGAVQDANTKAERKAARLALARKPKPSEDALPVAWFLGGKVLSHTILGAFLGLLGESVQLGFRARALLQIAAGLLMLLIAADLLGVKAVKALIPTMPARFGQFARRSVRTSNGLGPATLGFATVLIPCGVTLSVELLAISTGSPFAGAATMAVFVVGTSPLFAALGYAFWRSARAMRGRVGKVAALAVLVAGSFSINTGLVLAGSPVTFASLRQAMANTAPRQPGTSQQKPDDLGAAVSVENGTQQIVVQAFNTSYEPAIMRAKAGVSTTLTVSTQGTRGCTRSFVIPSLGVQEILPESGNTEFDLGVLSAGRISFTCGMGMYGGEIEVT